MTAVGYPLNAVSGAPAYTGRALRAASLAPLLAGATAARPLGARSGVRPGTPSTTVTVASMTWSVAPHAGILDVEAAAEAGPYGYAITAAETGSVNAAHATYTRWDGIYVQLSDPSESDGTSTPGVAVVYVAGTPSASPAMPAQPARSLLLARIVVPQSGGGSPSVVWLAPPCGLADGVPWFATEADRDAAIPAGQRRPGIQAVIGQGAGLTEYIHDGAAWVKAWPVNPFEAQTSLTTQDLDTVTTAGIYWQGSSSDATLARHYPATSAAGWLEVISAGSRWMQRYTGHPGIGANAGQVWSRAGGTGLSWTAWRALG